MCLKLESKGSSDQFQQNGIKKIGQSFSDHFGFPFMYTKGKKFLLRMLATFKRFFVNIDRMEPEISTSWMELRQMCLLGTICCSACCEISFNAFALLSSSTPLSRSGFASLVVGSA